MCFFLSPQRFLGVFTNSPTTSFIHVLTWRGQQRAPEALSFIYIAFLLWIENVGGFIKSTCHFHFEVGCYWKKGIFQAWSLSNLPTLFLIDMFHMTSGGFNIQWFLYLLWFASFRLFALCSLFLFFSCFWVFFLNEVWQGFITFKHSICILNMIT